MAFGLVWFLYLNETANASVDGGCPGSSSRTAHNRRSSYHCASSCWQRAKQKRFKVRTLLNNTAQSLMCMHVTQSDDVSLTKCFVLFFNHDQLWALLQFDRKGHTLSVITPAHNNNHQCNRLFCYHTFSSAGEQQTMTRCCKSQGAIQAEALSTPYISSAADG